MLSRPVSSSILSSSRLRCGLLHSSTTTSRNSASSRFAVQHSRCCSMTSSAPTIVAAYRFCSSPAAPSHSYASHDHHHQKLRDIDSFRHDFLSAENVAQRSMAIKKAVTEKSDELARLEAQWDAALVRAKKKVWWIGASIGAFLVAQWVVLANWVFVVFDWNLIEPVTYFLGLSCAWFAAVFYCLTGQEWSYVSINDVMSAGFAKREVIKTDADFFEKMESLREEIRQLHEAEDALFFVPKTERTVTL